MGKLEISDWKHGNMKVKLGNKTFRLETKYWKWQMLIVLIIYL